MNNVNSPPPPSGSAAAPQAVPTTESPADESVPSLISRLADDLSTLLSKEVALAKSEVREAADEAKAGVMAMAGGGIVALCGVLILLFGCVYALANVLPLWLSAFIVGAVSLVVGIVMLKGGQQKVEPGAFVPERTVEAVQRDKETIKRKAQ